jgi:hypothetical protein
MGMRYCSGLGRTDEDVFPLGADREETILENSAVL